jgi:hypothetical protein
MPFFNNASVILKPAGSKFCDSTHAAEVSMAIATLIVAFLEPSENGYNQEERIQLRDDATVLKTADSVSSYDLYKPLPIHCRQ